MRKTHSRRSLWQGFWNVAGPIFIVLAMTHQSTAPTTTYIGSDSERAGFGVTTELENFDVARLGGGWYVKWRVDTQPRQPAGYIYMPMLRISGASFSPNGSALEAAILANPHATWIVGNEVDNIYQDGASTTPQQYAVAYHDAYYFIKQRDPSAQIAINGVTQGTPLRLQWLDIVWNTYRSRYGTDMPVDVWNMHTFVLREQINSWGASIPPGVNATQGMLWEISDHDRIDLVRQEVIRFRQWMKDHGQQNKPLINTEYGILLPVDYGFDYPRVILFLNGTFDLFNTLRDPELGYPQDDYRLMQRWCWFSLDSDQFEGQYVRSLFDQTTRQITPLGQAFAAWTQAHYTPYVDLKGFAPPTYAADWAVFQNQPSTIRLAADVYNVGNLAAGRFDVRFGVGMPGTGAPIIGDVSFPNGLAARHSPPAHAEVTWSPVVTQSLMLYAQADPTDIVHEFNESNNTQTVTLVLPAGLDIKLSDLHSDPRSLPTVGVGGRLTVPLVVNVSNLGGIGVAGDLDVQFWLNNPLAGGTYLGSALLNVQNQPVLPVVAHFDWPDVPPGLYTVYAYAPQTGDTDPANNLTSTQINVAAARRYAPLIRH